MPERNFSRGCTSSPPATSDRSLQRERAVPVLRSCVPDARAPLRRLPKVQANTQPLDLKGVQREKAGGSGNPTGRSRRGKVGAAATEALESQGAEDVQQAESRHVDNSEAPEELMAVDEPQEQDQAMILDHPAAQPRNGRRVLGAGTIAQRDSSTGGATLSPGRSRLTTARFPRLCS